MAEGITMATPANTPTITTARYLCTGCPLGCRLEIDESEEGEIVEIRGFSCKRGREYTAQEHVEPRRMVTTTVEVSDGLYPRLPVKTSTPVPKALVMDVCQALRQVHVHAPIQVGDVILSNVLDTGINIVATRDMPTMAQS